MRKKLSAKTVFVSLLIGVTVVVLWRDHLVPFSVRYLFNSIFLSERCCTTVARFELPIWERGASYSVHLDDLCTGIYYLMVCADDDILTEEFHGVLRIDIVNDGEVVFQGHTDSLGRLFGKGNFERYAAGELFELWMPVGEENLYSFDITITVEDPDLNWKRYEGFVYMSIVYPGVN